MSYPMGNIQLLHARLQIGKSMDYNPKSATAGASSVSYFSAAVVSALRWLKFAYGVQNIPFLSLIRTNNKTGSSLSAFGFMMTEP